MLENIQLTSVNIGKMTSIRHGEKSMSTGICKRPVGEPVLITELGLDGDEIGDLSVHGGVDQAVYAYSTDDYDWWSRKTNGHYPPGLFGENLTIRGMPTDMNVGDRLLIGEVVLEATSPRIPCSTFATRMQDSRFGVAFADAERPGVYFRVLNEGEVSTGDAVTYVANAASEVSVVELFRFAYRRNHHAETLRRYLAAPISERVRLKVESKLAILEAGSD